MKKNPVLLSTINQQTLTDLTTTVKEELAKDHKKIKAVGLTLVDLWDIQRRQKPRLQRSYY